MNVWIIGGTGGIGRACAERLQNEGIDFFVTDKDTDVRDRRALVEVGDQRHPTGLIYAAGINYLEWSRPLLVQMMAHVYAVNVIGLLNALAAAPRLERVVVLGSDAAWRPMRTSVAYNASKAALHEAVKCIARERASERFAINVVAPGVTEPTKMMEYVERRTEEIRGWPPEKLREYENMFAPMQRRAQTAEVAEVVCKVLTMETPYLNGAVIPVNGAR